MTIRTNLPEFQSQMRQFGQDMRVRVGKRAIGAAAKVFADAAKRSSAFVDRSGTLRRSIYGVSSRYKKSKDTVYGAVSVRSAAGKKKAVVSRLRAKGQDAFYGFWVEGGHVKRGPGNAIRGGKRTKALLRARARSAGQFVEGRFFLAKAFRSHGDAALHAFNERMQEGIDNVNAGRKP